MIDCILNEEMREEIYENRGCNRFGPSSISSFTEKIRMGEEEREGKRHIGEYGMREIEKYLEKC